MKPRRNLFLGSFLVVAFGAVSSAFGATATWDGDTNANWNDSLNWSAAFPNAAADVATFNSDTPNSTITLGADITLLGLRFDTAASEAYTFNAGNKFILAGNGDVTVNSAVTTTQTINSGLQLGGNGGAATYNIVNNSTTAGQFLTFGGAITGGSGSAGVKVLAVAGNGNINFNGAVTRGGATSLTLTKAGNGTLKFGTASSVGLLTLNGGTIDLAADLTVNEGSGATGLSGAGGTITTSNGSRIKLAGGAASGNGVDWGVTAGGTITINPAIIDGGTYNNIDFYNTGTIILKGANTYSGGTGLYGTAVQVGVASVGSVGSITSGAFGTGAVTFGASANVSSDSTTARTILNAITFASNVTLGDATRNGKLTFSAAANLGTSARTITANSDVQFDGIMSGVGGGISKSGAGTLKLTGANTYTGTTTLTTGTIQIGVNSIGSVGSITSSAIGTGGIDFKGGTISSDSTTARTILNAVTYSSASTFGDSTNNGKLTFSAGVNLGTAQKNMTVNSAVEFSGKITGAGGGITKLGAGTLTLSGASSDYTGAMTFGVTDGTDGILLLADSSALGTSAGGLTIRGGTQTGGVQLTGGITISDAITFEGRQTSTQGDFISNLSGNNIVAGLMTGGLQGGNYNIGSQAGLIDFQGGITTTQSGRQINLRGAGNGKISGAITNTGSGTIAVRLQGSGIWELSAANSHVGTTSIAGAGTIKLAHNDALQNSALDTVYTSGGTVDFTSVNTPKLGGLTNSGNLVLPANVTSLTLNPGTGLTQTYTGSLSGGTGLALTKSGAGTQVLGNSNSYSGATTVSAGILNITTATALGSTSGVSVTGTAASGVLELANGVTVTGKSLTISGYGTGVRGALRAASGATAEWAGPVTIGGAGSTTDNRVGAMDNATLTISGKISDGTQNIFMVSADGATGKVIVSGANDYTGQTQIVRGTLAIGADNSLPIGTILNVHAGSSVTDPAVFDLNGYNQQVAGLLRGATNGGVTGTATVTNSGGTTKTLTISNTVDRSYDSAITGNLELVKAGAAKQTLTGTNSFAGGTRIDLGTLALGHATDTLRDNGAVNVNGGTLDLGTNTDTVGAVTLNSGSITGSGAGTLTGTGSNFDVRSGSISAKIGGTVGLDKTTDGIVTISSDNSVGGYSGATTVNAGKLLINGNISTSSTTVKNTATLGGNGTTGAITVESGGKLAPGNSIDLLTASGNVNLASGSIFEVEIDTATSYDKLGINLGGDLNITSGAKLGLLDFGSASLITLNSRLQLIDYSSVGSTWNGGLLTLGTEELSDSETFVWASQNWLINYDDTLVGSDSALSNGGNYVTITVIPEPRAAILGLLGTFALLRRRR